jgi:hypothetical protein
LGASPQTPLVGFAEFWVSNDLRQSRATLFAVQRTLLGHFIGGKPPNLLGRLRRVLGIEFLRSRTTLFASFSGKRRTLLGPLGRLRQGLGIKYPSAKQNNAFCFFFWKKKNITKLNGALCAGGHIKWIKSSFQSKIKSMAPMISADSSTKATKPRSSFSQIQNLIVPVDLTVSQHQTVG